VISTDVNSHKTLKTRLKEWGLSKYLNDQDAEDVLALDREAIPLVGGRVETRQRANQHFRRKRLKQSRRRRSFNSLKGRATSNVISLSPHPAMRPRPALALLGKLEAVLREVRALLERAKHHSMCKPAETALTWSPAGHTDAFSERTIQRLVWEGSRAFEEEDNRWAFICWRSAFLQLETLLWQPDLDSWTTFIRCCIRLQRFGAGSVGRALLKQLRGLRDELPLAAPNRALVIALTNTSFDELVNGATFILEAKLRHIELLWPNHSNAYTAYRLELAEELSYHGIRNLDTITLADRQMEGISIHEILDHVKLQASHVAKCMISGDYTKAEAVTRAYILDLERHTTNCESTPILLRPLAAQYAILGSTQYFQDKFEEAKASLVTALALHEETLTRSGQAVFNAMRLHRTYAVLEWLNSNQSGIDASVHSSLQIKALIKDLEKMVLQEVEVKENSPFRRKGLVDNAPPGVMQTKAYQHLLSSAGDSPQRVVTAATTAYNTTGLDEVGPCKLKNETVECPEYRARDDESYMAVASPVGSILTWPRLRGLKQHLSFGRSGRPPFPPDPNGG